MLKKPQLGQLSLAPDALIQLRAETRALGSQSSILDKPRLGQLRSALDLPIELRAETRTLDSVRTVREVKG